MTFVPASNADPVATPPEPWPSRLARWARFLIPRIVGLVFIWAGVQKAIDPSKIIRVLEFDGLPHVLAVAGAHVVWVGELLLGLLLCAGLWPRRVMTASIVVLLVFSVQLAYLIVAQNPPDDCGCVIIWEKYRDARLNMTIGLIRNALMAVALEWARLRLVREAYRPVDGLEGADGGVGPTPGAA